ncbi:MAG: bacillithiol biosynthesis cysteine-adding enzyme BshC [bacterium]
MIELTLEQSKFSSYLGKDHITKAYLTDFDTVAHRYSTPPNDFDGAVSARSREGAPREDVVEALKAYNHRLGAPPEVVRNIELLKGKSTFAIVTGQQAGLLTGPLYTVYKTISAIALSRQLDDSRHESFVPVFWVASNDSNLSEVDHTYIVDRDNDIYHLHFDLQKYSGMRCSDIPLDVESRDKILKELVDRTYDTDFRDGLLSLCRTEAKTYSEWFAKIMMGLFGRYGLIIIDPQEPEIKPLMRPIFEMEIKNPLVSTELVNRAGDEVEKMGFKRQLRRPEGNYNLFCTEDGLRNPIRSDVGKDVLLERLDEDISRFDPSAALRPIVQDFLLPTVAYIGGPAEVAYFAQLKEVYDLFHVPMPMILPRQGFTIVEAKIHRLLEKYDMHIDHLQADLDQIHTDLTRREADTERIVREAKEGIGVSLLPLRDLSAKIDPVLIDSLKTVENSIYQSIDDFEKRLVRHIKKRDDIVYRQLQKLQNNLFPNGTLQERVLNIFPYLFKYSPALLDKFMEIGYSFDSHYIVGIRSR